MNSYIRTKKYDVDFLKQNMMGPNSMIVLEELTRDNPLKQGMRILDLGCGKGLTSIFLAKEYNLQVFAVDLWVPATENLNRFKQMNVNNLIIPLHADALNLPFAEGYFDAVISVDSYHYFGNNDSYFTKKLRPLLKKDAWVAIAFPGMQYEVHDSIPEEMKSFWDEESLSKWHSIEWWKPKFENSLCKFTIKEMECFDKAWNDWLSTNNPYAVEDRGMINTDNGRYMNFISVTGNAI